MRIPAISGQIDRRILVNFRVAPDALEKILPAPFRPQLYRGYGIAGICLIRLRYVRPRFLPRIVGVSSENAAHRIAVQWDYRGEQKTGVYIPRRDSSSLLNAVAGGRLFPGVHHHARFEVCESDHEFNVEMQSSDGSARVLVESKRAGELLSDSIFPSVDAVSDFFEEGSVGYSPRSSGVRFDGLELRAFDWHVEPLEVTRVISSFFDNEENFPAGTIEFDNALLMRGIEHEWHGRESICCTTS